MTQCSQQVTIKNHLGLHIRAANKLCQLASQYTAQIIISNQHKQADASSVLALLMLGSCQGQVLTISCQGDDAQSALNAICQLVENKFDEAQ